MPRVRVGGKMKKMPYAKGGKVKRYGGGGRAKKYGMGGKIRKR